MKFKIIVITSLILGLAIGAYFRLEKSSQGAILRIKEGRTILSEYPLLLPGRNIKMRTSSEVRKHPFENRDITVWRAEIEENYGTWTATRDLIVLDPLELPGKLEELRQQYGQ